MTADLIRKVIPCFADKIIIDFCNSIEVNQDLIRVQEQRQSKLTRLLDCYTGTGKRRQDQINQNLQDELNSALLWLQTLTKQHAIGFQAIKKANSAIISLNEGMVTLVDYSKDTRVLLQEMGITLGARLDQLESRVRKLEYRVDAREQIDLLFEKWEAGEFDAYPIMLRLYLVFERLYWGEYGDFIRIFNGSREANTLMELLKTKCLKQLRKDAALDHDNFAGIRHWLYASSPKVIEDDLQESLSFMADWTDPVTMPFAYSAVNFATHSDKELPLHLPRIGNPESLHQNFNREFFEVRSV